MRLHAVETGHRLPQKLILRMIRLVSGDPDQPFDVVKTMLYRPEFFGKPYSELCRPSCAGLPVGPLESGNSLPPLLHA